MYTQYKAPKPLEVQSYKARDAVYTDMLTRELKKLRLSILLDVVSRKYRLVGGRCSSGIYISPMACEVVRYNMFGGCGQFLFLARVYALECPPLIRPCVTSRLSGDRE